MIPGVSGHPTLSSHTFSASVYHKPNPLASGSLVSPAVDLCYLYCTALEICAYLLLAKCADWLCRFSWNDFIHSSFIISNSSLIIFLKLYSSSSVWPQVGCTPPDHLWLRTEARWSQVQPLGFPAQSTCLHLSHPPPEMITLYIYFLYFFSCS